MYRYSEKLNTSYVDVQIDSYMELFNEWDFSPSTKRDLNQEFYQYIEESAYEISKKHKICIVLNMPKALENLEKEEESRAGLICYLDYRLRLLNIDKKIMKRKGLRYGFGGLSLMLLGTIGDAFISASPYYEFLALLNEGFIIGGWVLFWELFTMMFFEMQELREKEKVIRRLKKSEVTFTYNR